MTVRPVQEPGTIAPPWAGAGHIESDWYAGLTPGLIAP